MQGYLNVEPHGLHLNTSEYPDATLFFVFLCLASLRSPCLVCLVLQAGAIVPDADPVGVSKVSLPLLAG
jgi:hypothetical protein